LIILQLSSTYKRKYSFRDIERYDNKIDALVAGVGTGGTFNANNCSQEKNYVLTVICCRTRRKSLFYFQVKMLEDRIQEWDGDLVCHGISTFNTGT